MNILVIYDTPTKMLFEKSTELTIYKPLNKKWHRMYNIAEEINETLARVNSVKKWEKKIKNIDITHRNDFYDTNFDEIDFTECQLFEKITHVRNMLKQAYRTAPSSSSDSLTILFLCRTFDIFCQDSTYLKFYDCPFKKIVII